MKLTMKSFKKTGVTDLKVISIFFLNLQTIRSQRLKIFLSVHFRLTSRKIFITKEPEKKWFLLVNLKVF